MLKKYAGEEFLVLEIPLREKFMIPCKYIYPCVYEALPAHLNEFTYCVLNVYLLNHEEIYHQYLSKSL